MRAAAALGALVLAAAAGVASVVLRRPPAPPATPALEALAALRESATRHRVKLAALLADRRWEEAETEARELAGVDPLSAEAREALATAAREKAVHAALDAAARDRDLGRDEAALEAFLTVPRTSVYHRRARALVQELAAPVAARLRGDCLGLSARDPRVLARCRRYLDLTCHVRRDPDAERRMDALARRRGTWTCPADLAHWFAGGADASAELLAAVRRDFGEGEVAQAVVQHAALGRTRSAIEQLQHVAGDPRAPALSAQLRLVDARLQDGRAALLAGRLRDADAAWNEAFAADARVLPPGFASAAVAAARRELGDAWSEEAARLLGRKQLRAAESAIESGLSADPASVRLPALRRRLEIEATARIAAAGCVELREIAGLVPADARRRVEERLSACP